MEQDYFKNQSGSESLNIVVKHKVQRVKKNARELKELSALGGQVVVQLVKCTHYNV